MNVFALALATVLAGYYPANLPVASIPVDSLTDVIYAFGSMGAGSTCLAPGDAMRAKFAELRALRTAHPTLHLLVSIGGWGAAPGFSDAALTTQSRAAFARSCIGAYVNDGGFDGLDIDWEFPVSGGVPQNPHRPEDRANFTALMKELRTELDALGNQRHRHYFLTTAIPAGRLQYGGPYDPANSYDLQAVAAASDWLNVMTYDLNTTFSPRSGFNTPLYPDPRDPSPEEIRRWNNVSGAVRYFETHGVPANKIALGIAFYGRGFSGVAADNAGLYATYAAGLAETSWAQISATMLPDSAWDRHWSDTAQAPWLYNAGTHTFFTYDDPRSVAIKGAYARREGLRGAMFWVLGSDDSHDSLLHALRCSLGFTPC